MIFLKGRNNSDATYQQTALSSSPNLSIDEKSNEKKTTLAWQI